MQQLTGLVGSKFDRMSIQLAVWVFPEQLRRLQRYDSLLLLEQSRSRYSLRTLPSIDVPLLVCCFSELLLLVFFEGGLEAQEWIHFDPRDPQRLELAVSDTEIAFVAGG